MSPRWRSIEPDRSAQGSGIQRLDGTGQHCSRLPGLMIADASPGSAHRDFGGRLSRTQTNRYDRTRLSALHRGGVPSPHILEVARRFRRAGAARRRRAKPPALLAHGVHSRDDFVPSSRASARVGRPRLRAAPAGRAHGRGRWCAAPRRPPLGRLAGRCSRDVQRGRPEAGRSRFGVRRVPETARRSRVAGGHPLSTGRSQRAARRAHSFHAGPPGLLRGSGHPWPPQLVSRSRAGPALSSTRKGATWAVAIAQGGKQPGGASLLEPPPRQPLLTPAAGAAAQSGWPCTVPRP